MYATPRIRIVMILCAVICIVPLMYNMYPEVYSRYTGLVPHISFKNAPVARTSVLESSKHPQWIVVTSIQAPTPQVKILASIKGWKMIVVGDRKTPQQWRLPGVVYLSPKQQQSLGYAVLKYIPYNTYCRKIIGYLYAIQHGAKTIYDTDDDNAPQRYLTAFSASPRLTINASAALTYNPCAHFGQSSVWPRGYPLDRIGLPPPHTYALCPGNNTIRKSNRYPRVVVKQGLVNGDPDVDAIFRLTRKHTQTERIHLTFDESAPPLILPRGTFTPYNSQNTVFEYDALWSLVLPRTVTMRVTDIWRAYWSQALMWLIGGRLAYYPPITTQVRNAHSYIADAVDEADLYAKTPSLVEFLSHWTCRVEDTTLPQCAMQLTYDMAAQDFWTYDEVPLYHAWFQDLIDVGYIFPSLLSSDTSRAERPWGCDDPRHVTCFPTEQLTIRNHRPDLVPLNAADTPKPRKQTLCAQLNKQN